MQHNIFIAFDRFARFALCVARNAPRARENCAKLRSLCRYRYCRE